MDDVRKKTSDPLAVLKSGPAGENPAPGIGWDSDQAVALSILDGLEALVYASDMETYELLYLNDYGRRQFGDVQGRPCYEVLQTGQTKPCEFCTNHLLLDDDGNPLPPHRWEFQNTVNGRWYEIVDRAMRWPDGRLIRLEIAFDITERKQREDIVSHQASHDALTGLLNRHEMHEVIEKVHAGANRRSQPYSVLLFDLDRFKLLNDYYGHHFGDEVLRDVARAAEQALRKGDWLGRWGGEEFLCVMPQTTAKQALVIAERLRHGIEQLAFETNGRSVTVTTSIGVATFPEDAPNGDTLISCADGALYEAKRAGRNRVYECRSGNSGILSIAGRLEDALREGKVRPAYQPIVELASGNVVAEEALARVVVDNGKLLEADSFIEAASDLQLAHRIDTLIITSTIQRCSIQHIAGQTGPIKHFVNASADLLRHPDLLQLVLDEAYSACNACEELIGQEKPLVIEITEREFLGDVKAVRRVLAPLLDFGLTIAVDDFGSGYSSFQYLADLPVSYLKIEGSLVRRVRHESKVRAIVKGIHDIARDLGLLTVAEQIEDAETRDILTELGVDWGQGYFFGHPALDEAPDCQRG